MTVPQSGESTRKPLRLWPGVLLVAVQWFVWLVAPIVVPNISADGFLAAIAIGFAVLGWWLFFSRAPWFERLGAIVLMAAAIAATRFVVHESIAGGMMGMMVPIYSIPFLSLALVSWAVATRRVAGGARWAAMAGAILLVCAGFTVVRTGGISGEGESDLHWRWTPTPEERLLATSNASEAPAPVASAPAAETSTPPPPAASPEAPAPADAPGAPAARAATPDPVKPAAPEAERVEAGRAEAEPDAEWPGFRGPARDSVVRGVRIQTVWSQQPPVELWRRAIGPGWSSFAVRGDFVYTQEQRGEDEIVSCYRLGTGQPVWVHKDPVRFWESNGGAGPRATPTIHDDRIYTVGATGLVNALDARTGAAIWSRDSAADTGKEVPGWGFSGSPLVVDGLVIVAAAGRLVAYDIASGKPRWVGPTGGGGYSSPHLVTIDGVRQVVLLRGARTISVAPADGKLLWEHTWEPGVSIVQPARAGDDGILIAGGGSMGGIGIRRIAVARGAGGWTVQERWTSRGLKPYFNDLVVHDGHAFGFDGSILSCIDLQTGERKWKGGRYGHGQMLLLRDQGVLLVLSEEGELALLRAAPDAHTELARFKAIEGKTWNHPVLVRDILLVRNGEEMAAFRLPLGTE